MHKRQGQVVHKRSYKVVQIRSNQGQTWEIQRKGLEGKGRQVKGKQRQEKGREEKKREEERK